MFRMIDVKKSPHNYAEKDLIASTPERTNSLMAQGIISGNYFTAPSTANEAKISSSKLQKSLQDNYFINLTECGIRFAIGLEFLLNKMKI